MAVSRLARLRRAEDLAWAEYLSLRGAAGADYAVEGQSVQRSGPAQAAYQRWWELHEALRKAVPVEASVPVRSL